MYVLVGTQFDERKWTTTTKITEWIVESENSSQNCKRPIAFCQLVAMQWNNFPLVTKRAICQLAFVILFAFVVWLCALYSLCHSGCFPKTFTRDNLCDQMRSCNQMFRRIKKSVYFSYGIMMPCIVTMARLYSKELCWDKHDYCLIPKQVNQGFMKMAMGLWTIIPSKEVKYIYFIFSLHSNSNLLQDNLDFREFSSCHLWKNPLKPI